LIKFVSMSGPHGVGAHAVTLAVAQASSAVGSR
jgi:hypothetical protein